MEMELRTKAFLPSSHPTLPRGQPPVWTPLPPLLPQPPPGNLFSSKSLTLGPLPYPTRSVQS